MPHSMKTWRHVHLTLRNTSPFYSFYSIQKTLIYSSIPDWCNFLPETFDMRRVHTMAKTNIRGAFDFYVICLHSMSIYYIDIVYNRNLSFSLNFQVIPKIIQRRLLSTFFRRWKLYHELYHKLFSG